MGMLELPRRVRCADIAFAESRTSSTLGGRARLLEASNGFPLGSSAENVPMPFLDPKGADRMVQDLSTWQIEARPETVQNSDLSLRR